LRRGERNGCRGFGRHFQFPTLVRMLAMMKLI